MKIGIIGAMEVEVARLVRCMGGAKESQRAGMHFYEGQIGRTEVVVVRCGIGKVSAGLCVQILTDLFGITHVINTGVAGSLEEEIDIGDIVVSIDAMYHDMDVTGLGYEPGQVPQLDTRVVSGDQFICDRGTKDRIKKVFGGLCTEMEGAAIAQAAYINKIPFVIVRAISDKADESTEMSYEAFEAKAAEHCASLVEHMVRSF